jgi:hypothetical protein
MTLSIGTLPFYFLRWLSHQKLFTIKVLNPVSCSLSQGVHKVHIPLYIIELSIVVVSDFLSVSLPTALRSQVGVGDLHTTLARVFLVSDWICN